MKKSILPILLFCATVASAQTLELPKNGTGVTRTRESMSGAEAAKIFAAMKKLSGVVDEQGKPIDSMTAVKMAKTYEYQMGYRSLKHDGIYQMVLSKINMEQQAKRDIEIKEMVAPKNPALKEGVILDLKPFGDRIPETKVKDKAVILLFWYPGFSGRLDGFAEYNEITSNYIDKGKFEMYAVNRYPYEQAMDALKKVPINNAHQIHDARNLFDVYDPENKVVLIMTDKDHKIVYSAEMMTGIAPRIMNRLLKAL